MQVQHHTLFTLIHQTKRFAGLALLLLPLLLVSTWGNHTARANTLAPTNGRAMWTYQLPGMADSSSPVLADVTGDGQLEIVVGTHNGHVVVLNRHGGVVWSRDISNDPKYRQYSNSPQIIQASPTVADIDGNGSMEIIIATGTSGTNICYPGSIMVLDKNGQKAPGDWPFMMRDTPDLPPANCPAGVYSTPAVGDTNGDGKKEIALGSFDKGIYLLRHDGTLMPGFPRDSALTYRFPAWGNTLIGKLADTVWSSPALADMDGDGDLEIVIGTDEGHFGEIHGGNAINWFCPYPNTLTAQYCGGSLYVVHHDSQLYLWPDDNNPDGPRYPKYHWDHVQSTPAVTDLNGDGKLDVVYGMGTFYQNLNPSSPYANRVIAISGATGKLLPGWNDFPSEVAWGQGKGTNAATPASPAVGDITGDGQLNVVIPAMDGRVYAWHANGQIVSGFPVQTRDYYGLTQTAGFNVGTSPVLVDYDGDGDMEILILQNTTMVVLDGDGSQLSPVGTFDANAFNSELEVGKENGTRFIASSPAVGDIDGDGRLEAVVGTGLVGLESTGHIIVWKLPNSSLETHWPMYKQNAGRTSILNDLPGIPEVSQVMLYVLQEMGDDTPARTTLNIRNVGQSDLTWQVSNVPTAVSASPTTGTTQPNQTSRINITITPDPAVGNTGEVNLGSLRLTATDPENNEQLGLFELPITINYVDQIWRSYLPVATR